MALDTIRANRVGEMAHKCGHTMNDVKRNAQYPKVIRSGKTNTRSLVHLFSIVVISPQFVICFKDRAFKLSCFTKEVYTSCIRKEVPAVKVQCHLTHKL